MEAERHPGQPRLTDPRFQRRHLPTHSSTIVRLQRHSPCKSSDARVHSGHFFLQSVPHIAPRTLALLENEATFYQSSKTEPSQPYAMSSGVPFNGNATCHRCGRFGAYEFDGDHLCAECYETRGSCCPEFGRDDLWSTQANVPEQINRDSTSRIHTDPPPTCARQP